MQGNQQNKSVRIFHTLHWTMENSILFFSTLKASLRTHPFYNWADVTVQTDYRLQTVSICNLPWFKIIPPTTTYPHKLCLRIAAYVVFAALGTNQVMSCSNWFFAIMPETCQLSHRLNTTGSCISFNKQRFPKHIFIFQCFPGLYLNLIIY